jgi:transposase
MKTLTAPFLPCPSSGYRVFVGVDIAAKTAMVAWLCPGEPLSHPISIEQIPKGFVLLQQTLLALAVAPADILIVMEATGAYWERLTVSLVQAGFVVSVIHPPQAHDFAKALLKRAKTDAIDAQTLALFAERFKPAPWTPPPAIAVALEQRLQEREAWLSCRQRVRNQLHALLQAPEVAPSVLKRMQGMIETLTTQIAAVEGEMAQLLSQDEAWTYCAARLQTITGIGFLTAVQVLVTTHNFTRCVSAEQAAAYAGLVPYPRRSGTSVHGRMGVGQTGNARLRRALYLATLSATQYNPIIRAFYERLRAAGKPMKVARCAAARKLLHLAFAVVQNDQPFDPLYSQKHRVVS